MTAFNLHNYIQANKQFAATNIRPLENKINLYEVEWDEYGEAEVQGYKIRRVISRYHETDFRLTVQSLENEYYEGDSATPQKWTPLDNVFGRKHWEEYCESELAALLAEEEASLAAEDEAWYAAHADEDEDED